LNTELGHPQSKEKVDERIMRRCKCIIMQHYCYCRLIALPSDTAPCATPTSTINYSQSTGSYSCIHTATVCTVHVNRDSPLSQSTTFYRCTAAASNNCDLRMGTWNGGLCAKNGDDEPIRNTWFSL